MKRILLAILLLSATQHGYAASEVSITPTTTSTATTDIAAPVQLKIDATKTEAVKKVSKAFPTKDASVSMVEIKKNPIFAERYNKLEADYKETLMSLQQREREVQQDVKAGKLTEAQLYGKSQEFEFEFRNAQKKLQEGAMDLENKANEIISKITEQEGWDGCQVQMFSYVNSSRDITPRVIKALEEQLKAEDAAGKFKKPASTVNITDTESAKTTTKPAAKPGIKPAPKKKSANKSTAPKAA
jgi:hypothetical protein